jgi:hypothetical protein
LCMSIAACSAEAPPACGFVSDMSGKVHIERQKKTYGVQGLESVMNDDAITVEKGGTVTVNFCGLLKKVDIPGPAKAVVMDCKPKFESGSVKSETAIDGDLCRRLTRASINVVTRKKLESLGDYQGGGVYVPRNAEGEAAKEGKFYEIHLKPDFCEGDVDRPANAYAPALEKPFFSWSAVKGASRYRVEIKKTAAKNEGPVLSEIVIGNRFAYPNEASSLESEGCYTFDIRALGTEGNPLGGKQISFIVIGEDESEKFQGSERILKKTVESSPDSSAGYEYLGKYYEISGFYYDALEALKKALALEPGNAALLQKIKSIEKIVY